MSKNGAKSRTTVENNGRVKQSKNKNGEEKLPAEPNHSADEMLSVNELKDDMKELVQLFPKGEKVNSVSQDKRKTYHSQLGRHLLDLISHHIEDKHKYINKEQQAKEFRTNIADLLKKYDCEAKDSQSNQQEKSGAVYARLSEILENQRKRNEELERKKMEALTRLTKVLNLHPDVKRTEEENPTNLLDAIESIGNQLSEHRSQVTILEKDISQLTSMLVSASDTQEMQKFKSDIKSAQGLELYNNIESVVTDVHATATKIRTELLEYGNEITPQQKTSKQRENIQGTQHNKEITHQNKTSSHKQNTRSAHHTKETAPPNKKSDDLENKNSNSSKQMTVDVKETVEIPIKVITDMKQAVSELVNKLKQFQVKYLSSPWLEIHITGEELWSAHCLSCTKLQQDLETTKRSYKNKIQENAKAAKNEIQEMTESLMHEIHEKNTQLDNQKKHIDSLTERYVFFRIGFTVIILITRSKRSRPLPSLKFQWTNINFVRIYQFTSERVLDCKPLNSNLNLISFI